MKNNDKIELKDANFGLTIHLTKDVDGVPYNVFSATLKASQPFTKDVIEKFLKEDATLKKVMEDFKEDSLEVIYIGHDFRS